MTDGSQDLAEQYLSGLLRYLTGAGEAALQSAYEIGRKAIADGSGGLEMLAIHQKCLAVAMRGARNSQQSARMAERAGNFFAESLAPFEMALRGFREANTQLSRNLEDLRKAEAKLLKQHNELLTAHQALETERRRYRDLFDFAPDGYLVTDLVGRIEEANRAAETLLGAGNECLAGNKLLQFVAETSHDEFETRRRWLLENGADRVEDWQFVIRSHTSVSFPATLSVRVVRDASGRPVSLRWLLRDVTERNRIEEERAQLLVRERVGRAQLEGAQRFAFLAEIGTLLVASLDCETTLGAVARRIVPYLADWCLIYLVESDDRIRLLCEVHTDPAKTDAAARLSREPVAVNPQSRLARVLSEGQAQAFSEVSSGDLIADQMEVCGIPLDPDLKSLLVVPMKTQGRAVGFMVLGTPETRRYQNEHLALAEDLARRCALAVDNTRLYRAMTAERDKAAEANRAKDEFLGILGHELRNPLTPILGWARSFRTAPGVAQNPVLSQGIDTLERNARNILRLADDCLDLVRISERKVMLENEPLDLNQTVRGSIEAFRQTAQEKGLQLVTQLSSSSLWILADRTRIEQVMINLLINAIKYTDAGGVLSIRCSRVNDQAEIEVQDTGIGIAPEFLEQVFQPFRRGSKEWLTSDAGLGLGLAIARKIVEMHGGTIWAESPGLGGGSTFHLRLRLAPAGLTLPSFRAAPEPLPAGSLRVLLIDDQKDVADLTKMDLESLGYSVLTATNGEAGLEVAIREVPDVIISDVKMPLMDGYELIRRLRSTPGLTSVPVVALTGFGMKKDVEAALAAGFSAHLNKPTEANELSDLIQSLVTERRTSRAGT